MMMLLLWACSTVHGVKPVGEGNLELQGSFGGPIVEVFGAPIPVPVTTLGVTYGLSETLDVHGAVHPSALALFKVVEMDAGVSMQFIAPSGARPRLMGDFSLIGAAGNLETGLPEGGGRLFLQPSLTASWDWGQRKRQTVYTGLTLFFEPFPSVHAVGGWVLGERWGLTDRTHLDTELKWLAPYASSYDLVIHYYSPGNMGAISFQLGLGHTFGKGH